MQNNPLNSNNPMSFLSNPLFQQAQKMAQGKTADQLQMVAQNICNQRGIDFNEAMNAFKQQFGGFR